MSNFSKWVSPLRHYGGDDGWMEEYRSLVCDVKSDTALDGGKCPRYYKLVYEYIESLNTIKEAYEAWELEFIPFDMNNEDEDGKLLDPPKWLKLKPNDELIQPMRFDLLEVKK